MLLAVALLPQADNIATVAVSNAAKSNILVSFFKWFHLLVTKFLHFNIHLGIGFGSIRRPHQQIRVWLQHWHHMQGLAVAIDELQIVLH